MAEFFDALTDEHIAFVEKQPVFFVSTANAEGRINLSPQGLDCFRVLGPSRVVGLELDDLACRTIDVAWNGATPSAADADAIARELLGDASEALVAYRNGRRFTQSFDRAHLPEERVEPGNQSPVRTGT